MARGDRLPDDRGMDAPADLPTRPPASADDPPPADRGATSAWPPPADRPRFPWQRPSLSAAAWLASTGAALLFIASVIVVASRWESIPPEIRFSGLVAALLATHFASEAGRRRFPATSTALATLAAAMTAPVGVAAAATLGQPWPVCVLVGGLAALVTTEYQSRRRRVPALKAASAVAFGMAAVGGAALTGAPAPLIAAVGAAAALVLGATGRSVALGAAVGVSPALALLADAGVGDGTLERIGVVGAGLAWSAPLSGLIAAIVIGITAHRRQNVPLALGAVAALTAGVVTGLLAGDVSPVVWWCLPSVALIVLESLGSPRVSAVWRRLSVAAPVLATAIASVGLFAPLVFAARRVDGTATPAVWALPLLLGGVALLSSAAGSARRAGNGWASAGLLLGAAGAFVGAATVAGAPLLVVALLALALWIGISTLTPWNTSELTASVTAFWGLIAVTADLAEPRWAQIMVVAGFGIALALAISFVERADEGLRLVVAAAVIAGATHVVVDSGRAVEGLLTIVAMTALGVALRPRHALVPLSVAEAAVVLSFLDAQVGWWHVGAVALLALACAAAADRSLRSPWAHLAAGLAVAVAALSLAVAGFDAPAITVLLGVAAVATTGLATLRDDYLPLDTAALVAGGLTLGVALAAPPVFISLAAALLGAQGIVFGTLHGTRPLAALGGAGLTGAIASLWWTTGTNALVLDAVAPYGATGADIVVGATGLGLLGIGWAIRRASMPSSWLAYSPGLGLLGTWLLSTQLEPGTDWATVGALALGVLAIGVGGFRRLGAPLVIGTALIAGTLLVSAGPRLAEAPTWAWIAIGGLGLLALAAIVERDERPLLPSADPGTSSLVEEFWKEFG